MPCNYGSFCVTMRGKRQLLVGVSAFGLLYHNTIDWGWGQINNRHLFLTVLGAGKSKIKVPADPASGESPLPDS